MISLREALEAVIGTFDFYVRNPSSTSTTSYMWDYGEMLWFLACVCLVCIVVSSVFRIISKLFTRR